MCGTPSYLAPEVVLQVNHEGYQQVVDSWSVGVIVYSMYVFSLISAVHGELNTSDRLTNVAPFETQPQDIPVKEQVNTRRVNWTYLTQHHVSPEGDFSISVDQWNLMLTSFSQASTSSVASFRLIPRDG